jgi:hypothetical protein
VLLYFLTQKLTYYFATVRLIYVSTDPIYTGRFYVGYESHMMVTITYPIDVITTLLIALYWGEILQRKQARVSAFLKNLKIPFWIASVVLVGLELTVSALRVRYSRPCCCHAVGKAN